MWHETEYRAILFGAQQPSAPLKSIYMARFINIAPYRYALSRGVERFTGIR
jgi:hypothetical protein